MYTNIKVPGKFISNNMYPNICIKVPGNSPKTWKVPIASKVAEKEKLVPCQRAALYHVRTNATASHEARLGAS
jgi:hypothetical protein